MFPGGLHGAERWVGGGDGPHRPVVQLRSQQLLLLPLPPTTPRLPLAPTLGPGSGQVYRWAERLWNSVARRGQFKDATPGVLRPPGK